MNDVTKEKLKEWCLKLIQEYTSEAVYSGMFSGGYWQGKADALKEVLNYIKEEANE